MLKAIDGSELELLKYPNGHILTWGRSGQGKTFFLTRFIETCISNDESCVVFDYSGSFTEGELREKECAWTPNAYRMKKNYKWKVCVERKINYVKDITESLGEVLGCRSYIQNALLEKAVDEIVGKNAEFTFPALYELLQRKIVTAEETKIVENLDFLLRRLYKFRGIDNFSVIQSSHIEKDASVAIVDWSSYSDEIRKAMTKFQLSLLWREIFRGDFSNRFDTVVLDEFQFLPIGEGSTLTTILREGRKKGVRAVLSTQFVNNYRREELLTLQQAANILIFRPVEKDLSFCLDVIGKKKREDWKVILRQLQIGEAILIGNYHLRGKHKHLETPVVVKIVESREEKKGEGEDE